MITYTLWQATQLVLLCMVAALQAPAALWVLCYYFPPPKPPTIKNYEQAWFLAFITMAAIGYFDPPAFIVPQAAKSP